VQPGNNRRPPPRWHGVERAADLAMHLELGRARLGRGSPSGSSLGALLALAAALGSGACDASGGGPLAPRLTLVLGLGLAGLLVCRARRARRARHARRLGRLG
jgi:hypothetical protein